MTVKQLKEKLNEFPDHMDVYVAERVTDFRYGLVNSISVREINFCDESEGEVLATDKAVVLDEE